MTVKEYLVTLFSALGISIHTGVRDTLFIFSTYFRSFFGLGCFSKLSQYKIFFALTQTFFFFDTFLPMTEEDS